MTARAPPTVDTLSIAIPPVTPFASDGVTDRDTDCSQRGNSTF